MKLRLLPKMLSGEEQDLGAVWAWYELQRALIGEEKGRVLRASGTAGDVAPRYFGKTRGEVGDDFAFQADELGKVTMLGMLACTEGALRVDFIVRGSNRERDLVSRAFSAAFRSKGADRIRLEEDILDGWRDHGAGPMVKGAVGDFKGAPPLRHWLAHGRYWKPRLGRASGYQPTDVFDICSSLLQATGIMPENPDAA